MFYNNIINMKRSNLTLEVLMNKLKEIRIKKGFRAVDLSVRAGVSPATIWLIENGYDNARESTKKKICRVLECKVEEVFLGD
jgi:DNA-binding XRE family transcriptional regulator